MRGSPPHSIEPLGDSALRIELSDDAPHLAAVVAELHATWSSGVTEPSGVTEIVPGYATVVVHYDSGASFEALVRWAEQSVANTRPRPKQAVRATVVDLPVCYDGPDRERVAAESGLTVDEVVALHTGGTYEVRLLGFLPGFAYLEGLDPRLATPRLASPRTKVPAGSVGIGGNQTGVYPSASPGGWNLLGTTPLRLFDAQREKPALLALGDRVRFHPIDRAQFDRLAERPEPRAKTSPSGEPLLELLEPGSLTTVQDLGRPGHQAIGVSPGGAMDRAAARLANLLVGNPDGAPLLETTLVGPKLRLLRDVVVATAGAHAASFPAGRPVAVARGEVIDLRQLQNGARCYLALEGGICAEPILGGCGTDLKGGFAGRKLEGGDLLWGGGSEASRRTIRCSDNWFADATALVEPEGVGRIRWVRGPQFEWLTPASQQALFRNEYVVASRSDRMGLRLEGPPLAIEQEQELRSEGVVFGSVQIPSGGEPIVLMADRQTVGGYPTVGCVATVDLPRLAQLRPGAPLRFVEISVAEAHALRRDHEHRFALVQQAIAEHA